MAGRIFLLGIRFAANLERFFKLLERLRLFPLFQKLQTVFADLDEFIDKLVLFFVRKRLRLLVRSGERDRERKYDQGQDKLKFHGYFRGRQVSCSWLGKYTGQRRIAEASKPNASTKRRHSSFFPRQ